MDDNLVFPYVSGPKHIDLIVLLADNDFGMIQQIKA
jgi:hypothetical protein